jgi:methionyl-tRNA formyltransferase
MPESGIGMSPYRFFGKNGISRLIVVGRGPHVVCALRAAIEEGIDNVFFSSPRLADDEGVRSARSLSVNFNECTKLSMEDLVPFSDSGAFLLSVGSPFILSDQTIELFDGRMVNLHGGSLPLFRGGGTYSWQILMNAFDGASTVHSIAPEIDAGEIISQRKFRFPDSCRLPRDFLGHQWREDIIHLKAFLRRLFENEPFQRQTQDEDLATYFPRLHTETHGYLDVSWPVDDAARFIRAFSHPYPGAISFLGNERIRLFDASVKKIDEPDFHPFQFGLVINRTKDQLEIAANGGRLVISEFSCQSMIKVGDRIYTPLSFIDAANMARVKFMADGRIRVSSD